MLVSTVNIKLYVYVDRCLNDDRTTYEFTREVDTNTVDISLTCGVVRPLVSERSATDGRLTLHVGEVPSSGDEICTD